MDIVEMLRKPCDCNNEACAVEQTMNRFGINIDCDDYICDSCQESFNNNIANLIAKYYLPKPLFEDGELVGIGDEFIDGAGNIDRVMYVSYERNFYSLNGENGSTTYQIGDRVQRPIKQVTEQTQQDIWNEVDSYLNQYAENYWQAQGNGVYDKVKMIPIDAVDDAMHMIKNFYDNH